MVSVYLIVTLVFVLVLLFLQDRAINLLLPIVEKLASKKTKDERKRLRSGIYYFYYSLATILVALFWLIYAIALYGNFTSKGITFFILVLGVFFSYMTYRNLIEAFFMENLDKKMASDREKSKKQLLRNVIKKTDRTLDKVRKL
ncbi:MAG: hypothetical protein AABW46_00815 [Nanoarchaeota archaeon]